jgi:hypothetical protein
MAQRTNGTNGFKPANGDERHHELLRKPLEYSGSLDDLEYTDLTTIIGREFPKVQLTDWLKSENADVLLRDLAITSERTTVYRERPRRG